MSMPLCRSVQTLLTKANAGDEADDNDALPLCRSAQELLTRAETLAGVMPMQVHS